MGGFIKLHRSVRKHWVFSDPEYFIVWIEMLMVAKFEKEPKSETYEGTLYTLNYADFIFGRPSWSKRLGISEQRLKRLVKKFLDDGMIKLVKKHNKFTIYHINNYEKYHQDERLLPQPAPEEEKTDFFQKNSNGKKCNDEIDQHANQQKSQHQSIENIDLQGFGNQQNNQVETQQRTSREPAENQQRTNNKNVKNLKNGKEASSGPCPIAKNSEVFLKNSNPSTLELLYSYLDDGLEEELIVEVIRDSAKNATRSPLNLCKTILNRCVDQGIKTLENYIQDAKSFSELKTKQSESEFGPISLETARKLKQMESW